MESPARIAVVGGGWWATTAHLPAIDRNPDAVLAAIVEPDEERRRTVAQRFAPQEAYATLDELLAAGGVDGVVIAVPHSLHYPLALRAIQAGKHVVLEKPMVVDPSHGAELVAAAQRNSVELIVGYPYHFTTQVLELRRRILAGEIGTIEHVTCLFASVVRAFYSGDPEEYRESFGFGAYGPLPTTYSEPGAGGQGHTQVTHAAALLLWLTGLDVTAVSAFTANSGLEVDISDALALEFTSGAVGTLASTGTVSQTHPEMLEYRIFGTGGHVTFDPYAGIARVHTADGGLVELDPVPEPDRYPMFAPADNLVDVVLGRAPNGSPASVGLATVQIISAMHRSAASRRAVAIGTAGPRNVGQVWRVASGRAEEYRVRHASVWPEIEVLLLEYGVRAYTIYLWGEVCFSHMEVDDFVRLAELYGRDPIAERWEQEMGDLLEYPNADPETGQPELLREVWSL